MRRNKRRIQYWREIEDDRRFGLRVDTQMKQMNAKLERVMKEDMVRSERIKGLTKWEDFRFRRDKAIIAYFMVKKRVVQLNCWYRYF